MAINAQEFREALEAIEQSKGISKEIVLQSLHEAMTKGFKKQLGGDDALVEVIIDLDQGVIDMCQIKKIVADVEDDFLEISLEDAQEEVKANRGYIKDDEFRIPASISDLRKATAMSIKSILKQKFAEVEKGILYDAFKGKINTLITGKVEKFDERRGCSVNIGRTSIYLPYNQMIGDEKFNAGDEIRLFVSDVETGPKGARIVVSRSNEGFLNALFVEEVREIYDGTIVVKAIAREAGERSKIAVYSLDPNVDPAGACIGNNGNRIQKIVAQLGNGLAKEKIDVITFSDNPGLFIMESLKPARVAGVTYDENSKKATAIVKDDSFSLAIGRRGVNARLAVRLTGYNIDIKTESDALEQGIAYNTYEELQALDLETKARALQEARIAAIASTSSTADVLPGLPEGYVAPQERVYEDEQNDFDETLLEKAEKEETVDTPVVEETPVVAEEEEVKEETPVVSEVQEVKTTTTLSDLEKSLEDASSGANKKTTKKKFSHKKKEEETEEVKVVTTLDPSNYMSIYTEEELREMEEEEKEDEYYDDEVDYEDYDEYYDDDDK